MRIDTKLVKDKLSKFWSKAAKKSHEKKSKTTFITLDETLEQKPKEGEKLVYGTPLESKQFKDLVKYVAKGQVCIWFLEPFIGEDRVFEDKDPFVVLLNTSFSAHSPRDLKDSYNDLYNSTRVLYSFFFYDFRLRGSSLDAAKDALKNVEAYSQSLKNFVETLDAMRRDLKDVIEDQSDTVRSDFSVFEGGMESIDSGKFLKEHRCDIWEKSSQLRGPNR